MRVRKQAMTRVEALVSEEGVVRWMRDSGPNMIMPSGTISYWCGAELHRTDGPALIKADGETTYVVYGHVVAPLEFFTRYGTL